MTANALLPWPCPCTYRCDAMAEHATSSCCSSCSCCYSTVFSDQQSFANDLRSFVMFLLLLLLAKHTRTPRDPRWHRDRSTTAVGWPRNRQPAVDGRCDAMRKCPSCMHVADVDMDTGPCMNIIKNNTMGSERPVSVFARYGP